MEKETSFSSSTDDRIQTCKLKFSQGALSDWILNQGDANYQHVKAIMNPLGKKPIIPAWQIMSYLANQCIPTFLEKGEFFSVEASFNNFISPDEEIDLQKKEYNDRIDFSFVDHFNGKQSSLFGKSIGITYFLENNYEETAKERVYSRSLQLEDKQLLSFAKIFPLTCNNSLLNTFFIASYATSVIVLSFKDPRNEFEEKVNRLRNRHESTPFYKYLRVNFNKMREVNPDRIVYKYNGEMKGIRTVLFNIRALVNDYEVLNGIYQVDFLAKRVVLQFAKDM